MVQQASLRIPSLVEPKRERSAGRAPQLIMTWVWTSSPVTMLPTDRRAGVCTEVDACISSSTRRRGMPASITAWILSLEDRKSTRLNSSHGYISYAVFCLKKKKKYKKIYIIVK